MMKHRSPRAFTLVEMITVIAVIIVLAGLVISISGVVQQNAAKGRAAGEMKNLQGGIASYKNDNGDVPETGDTDLLDPRQNFNPASGKDFELYKKANKDLYKALSGDYEPGGNTDGVPDQDRTAYIAFTRAQLNTDKDAQGNVTKIDYIKDPFGYPYGYSTAGADMEKDYVDEVKKNPNAKRNASTPKGFNPTYDLWSTSGATNEAGKDKWVKNWGS